MVHKFMDSRRGERFWHKGNSDLQERKEVDST